MEGVTLQSVVADSGLFHPREKIFIDHEELEQATIRHLSIEESPSEVVVFLSSCFTKCADFLSGIPRGIYNYFAEGIRSIKNGACHLFTSAYYRCLSQKSIDSICNEFNKTLFSISSIEQCDESSQAREALLNRDKLATILKQFKHPDNAKMNSVIEVIEKRIDQHLSVQEWAYVSSMLDTIALEWGEIKATAWNDYATAQSNYEGIIKKLVDNKKVLSIDHRGLLANIENQEAIDARVKAEAYLLRVRRQEFLLKILGHVKLISRFEWAHLAQEEILDRLEDYYKPLWNQGYSDATVYSGYVGTSVGFSLGQAVNLAVCDVSAGITYTGAYENELFLDDERCPGEVRMASLSMDVEAKVALPQLAQVSMGFGGCLMKGFYREWDSARDYATDQFKTLIHERPHRDDPDIIRFLSRSSVLANEQTAPGYKVLTATRNEVTEIDTLKREYDLIKGNIDQQFSIFLNSVDQTRLHHSQPLPDALLMAQIESRKQEVALRIIAKQNGTVDFSDEQLLNIGAAADNDPVIYDGKLETILQKWLPKVRCQEPVKLNTINVAQSSAVDAEAIAYSGHAEIGASGGFGGCFSAGGSVAYHRKHFVLPDVKRTPLCERLANPLKSKAEKAIETATIVKEIEIEFHRFKDTMLASWTDESAEIKLSKAGQVVSAMTFDDEVTDDAFLSYLDPHDFSHQLLGLRQNKDTMMSSWRRATAHLENDVSGMLFDENVTDEEFLAFLNTHHLNHALLHLRHPLHKGERSALLSSGLIEVAKESDLGLEKSFKYLKMDFDFYTRLHARIAGQEVQTQKDKDALHAFVQRYGAENSEQFVHRMVVANAYLFSKAVDVEFKEKIMAFEQQLLSPQFDVDLDYLLEHAYFEEDLDYEIIDNKLNASVNFTSIFPIGLKGSIKVEIMERERKFPNPLRDGFYLDINLSIKGDIGDITETINSIAAAVNKNVPKEAANHANDQLKLALQIAGSTWVGESELVRQIRFYKPRDYADKMPYRKIFKRWSLNQGSKYAIDRILPAGVANVSFGLGYATMTTDCLNEVYTGETFFYLFMQGMREYYLKFIDDKTGEIKADSYWHTILAEQRPAFEQLFANIGREQINKATKSFVLDDLLTMRDNISKNKLTDAEIAEAKRVEEKAVKDVNDMVLLVQKMREMSGHILKGSYQSKENQRNKDAGGEIHRLARRLESLADEMIEEKKCSEYMAELIEELNDQIASACKKVIANAMTSKSAAKIAAEEIMEKSCRLYESTRKSTESATTLLNELAIIGDSIESNVKLTPEVKRKFVLAKTAFLKVMEKWEIYNNAAEKIKQLRWAIIDMDNLIPTILDENEKNLVAAKMHSAEELFQTLGNELGQAKLFFEEKGMPAYDYCVQRFQELMHAFQPQWAERYYNSDLLRARSIAQVEVKEDPAPPTASF